MKPCWRKFDKEHTHDEDEVRFILAGRGIFFLNIAGRVASVEVGPGDMLTRAARHDALVYAVRGSPHPRHSLVSGHGGLDAALHRLGRRPGRPALVLWARVLRAARGHWRPRMTQPKPPRLFLLDVEGTIAPMSLVSEQLFPYARAHFESYLQQHAADPRRSLAISRCWRKKMLRKPTRLCPSSPRRSIGTRRFRT